MRKGNFFLSKNPPIPPLAKPWLVEGGKGGFFSLFLLLCLLVCQNAFAGKVLPLIETQWLADNLKEMDMRIVYVANTEKEDLTNFDKEHIPGAVYLDMQSLEDILGDGSTSPGKVKFEELMSKLGVSNNTHVVLYGTNSRNPYVTAAFWLMKYNMHKNISYLNGGMTKWKMEKREMTNESAIIIPSTYNAIPDESIRANADFVLKNIKNHRIAIVDTRNPDGYAGKDTKENKRTGHIPGAVNITFSTANLVKDAVFKSINDLRTQYESKGVTRDKEVITYCQGGIRAAHTYFVLKHILGYPKVRVYTGSWAEWSKLPPEKYPAEK